MARFRILVVLLLLSACAWSRPGAADVRDWMPTLPPLNDRHSMSRGERIRIFLPHVLPRMSVAQVLVLLGPPDGGYTRRGKFKWFAPRDGVLRYTVGAGRTAKGGGREVVVFLDAHARVERIEENGAVIAKAPPNFFHQPRPRGVPWRRE